MGLLSKIKSKASGILGKAISTGLQSSLISKAVKKASPLLKKAAPILKKAAPILKKAVPLVASKAFAPLAVLGGAAYIAKKLPTKQKKEAKKAGIISKQKSIIPNVGPVQAVQMAAAGSKLGGAGIAKVLKEKIMSNPVKTAGVIAGAAALGVAAYAGYKAIKKRKSTGAKKKKSTKKKGKKSKRSSAKGQKYVTFTTKTGKKVRFKVKGKKRKQKTLRYTSRTGRGRTSRPGVSKTELKKVKALLKRFGRD